LGFKDADTSFAGIKLDPDKDRTKDPVILTALVSSLADPSQLLNPNPKSASLRDGYNTLNTSLVPDTTRAANFH
jgi:hypothetical protein